MILMESCYDSGKNVVLFVKIGAMVLNLQLVICVLTKAFGPNCPKLDGFKAPDTKSHSFLRFKIFFKSSFIKFCIYGSF